MKNFFKFFLFWIVYCQIFAAIASLVFGVPWSQTELGVLLFSVFVTALVAGS